MDQLLTKFKDTETKYNELKTRLGKGEITQDQAKAEIKKLMIQDDTGTYWMVGGKTGKWYKHINNQWQEANPYEELFPPVIPEAPALQETEKEEEAVFSLDSYQTDNNSYEEAGQVQKLETLGKLSYGDQSDAELQLHSESTAKHDDQYDQFNQYDHYNNEELIDNKDKTDTFTGVSRGSFEMQQEEHQEEDDAFSLSKYQSDSHENMSLLDGQESVTNMQYEEAVDLDSFNNQSKAFTFATPHQTEDDYASGGGLDFGDASMKIEDTNPYQIKEDEHYSERETGYGIAIDLDQEEAASSPKASAAVEEEQAIEDSYIPRTSKPLYQSIQEEEQSLAASGFEKSPSAQEIPRAAKQTIPPVSAQSFASQDEAVAPALDLSQYTQCVICSSKIPPIAIYCPFCGANQKELEGKTTGKTQPKRPGKEGESELVIKSIRIFSLFFFFGGVGLILGVLLGATYGVLKDFPLSVPWDWPELVGGTRGGFVGGLVFAAIGGIGGFFLFAVFSLIPSCCYNLLAFVFGGVRFRVKA